MAHKNTGGVGIAGDKKINRMPDKNDPTYPLRIAACRAKSASMIVLPSAPVLMGEFILEPDSLTLIISEPWESGPGTSTLILEPWEYNIDYGENLQYDEDFEGGS